MRKARIAILGGGVVGCASAGALGAAGHAVVVFEKNQRRRAELRRLVDKTGKAGGFCVASTAREALETAECAMIAVATPSARGGAANVNAVFAAAQQVARFAPARATCLLRSTVPPGTCAALHRDVFVAAGRPDIAVVFMPEFLREAAAKADARQPSRVVFGLLPHAPKALQKRLAEVFVPAGVPAIMASAESAELGKYASNAMLAARVGLMNEIASLAERTSGASMQSVEQIVGADPRIGPDFLEAGIGFGGGCLPKDAAALRQLFAERGSRCHLLPALLAANKAAPRRFADRIIGALPKRPTATVALLGLGFSPGSGNAKHSPALAVAHQLLAAGIAVRAADPFLKKQSAALPRGLVFVGESAEQAATNADAVALCTAHVPFVSLRPTALARVMAGRLAFDGRNQWNQKAFQKAGFRFVAVGQGEQERF